MAKLSGMLREGTESLIKLRVSTLNGMKRTRDERSSHAKLVAGGPDKRR